VLREDGSDPVDLPVEVNSLLPVWSPDGTLLTGSTGSGVVIIDLDGNVLATIDGGASGVAWQPVFD